MKLQSIIRYQLSDSKKSLLIFYAIMFSIPLLTTTGFLSFGSGSAEVRGTEMASAIFIFVIGLNSFRANFLFSQANGVSRKTQFKGFLVTILLISGVMAIIDAIYTHLFSLLVPYMSFFSMIYGSIYLTDSAPLSALFGGLLWSFFLYALYGMFGYFVTLVYYRSGLIMKLVVSIVPAIFIFFVLPYLAFVNLAVSRVIVNLTVLAFGLGVNLNPYQSMFTFSLFFIIFAIGSYLLMRRAPIK